MCGGDVQIILSIFTSPLQTIEPTVIVVVRIATACWCVVQTTLRSLTPTWLPSGTESATRIFVPSRSFLRTQETFGGDVLTIRRMSGRLRSICVLGTTGVSASAHRER